MSLICSMESKLRLKINPCPYDSELWLLLVMTVVTTCAVKHDIGCRITTKESKIVRCYSVHHDFGDDGLTVTEEQVNQSQAAEMCRQTDGNLCRSQTRRLKHGY